MADKFYEINGKKYPKVKYYKTDNGKRFIKQDGGYYMLKGGELVANDYYMGIGVGKCDVTEISEAEFNEAVEKSKAGIIY